LGSISSGTINKTIEKINAEKQYNKYIIFQQIDALNAHSSRK